jgi:hypothetical protein
VEGTSAEEDAGDGKEEGEIDQSPGEIGLDLVLVSRGARGGSLRKPLRLDRIGRIERDVEALRRRALRDGKVLPDAEPQSLTLAAEDERLSGSEESGEHLPGQAIVDGRILRSEDRGAEILPGDAAGFAGRREGDLENRVPRIPRLPDGMADLDAEGGSPAGTRVAGRLAAGGQRHPRPAGHELEPGAGGELAVAGHEEPLAAEVAGRPLGKQRQRQGGTGREHEEARGDTPDDPAPVPRPHSVHSGELRSFRFSTTTVVSSRGWVPRR